VPLGVIDLCVVERGLARLFVIADAEYNIFRCSVPPVCGAVLAFKA
jgi:hypothetical protein